LVAIVFFVASQWVSSIRLNFIFHQSKFLLSQKSNLKLYFVGMFYNFFIPGGIGGDAYKVYLLNKQFDWKLKTLTQNVLADRLIGLVAIVFIACVLSSYLFFEQWWFLVVGFIAAILSYLTARWFLKLFITNLDTVYQKSFLYSLIIQVLQILSVYFILLSIEIDTNPLGYFLVFLISSVASVISFSGFGAREFIFLQASIYLATDAVTATSIGLTFNMITAIISLLGVLFLMKKINLKLISE
jgi:uncharacterized membrane protein YbhN (UPF0104 family)